MMGVDALPEDFRRHGLPVLMAIGAGSVVALAIFAERWITLRHARVVPRALTVRVRDLVARGEVAEAMTTCKLDDSPAARVWLVALREQGRPRAVVKERVEEAGRLLGQRLRWGVGALELIAILSPLLGLFGTVWGMIDMFLAIQRQGVGDAAAMAGGIGTALYATLGGLTVAIPVRVFHSMLEHRIDAALLSLEEEAVEAVDLVARREAG
jgi:biopolymer transport protein ExbB